MSSEERNHLEEEHEEGTDNKREPSHLAAVIGGGGGINLMEDKSSNEREEGAEKEGEEEEGQSPVVAVKRGRGRPPRGSGPAKAKVKPAVVATTEEDQEGGDEEGDSGEEGGNATTATTKSGPTIFPLPMGQIDKVIKASLPDGMHVAKEAKIALHKAANVTVLMLGTLADEERLNGGVHSTAMLPGMSFPSGGGGGGRKKKVTIRSTLTDDDVINALDGAGFAHLIPQLRTSLGEKRRRGASTD